jgi:hypothetical protein
MIFDGNWFRRWASRSKGQRNRRNRGTPQRRPLGSSLLRFESLEDRRLLSVATATLLQGFPSTSQYGQPVELVAKVTTSPASLRGSGPTGTVNFYLGSPTGTSLGSATVTKRGTATLYSESTPLPVGATDAIYAVYSGDTNFGGSQTSLTETVNAASTHTVVSASSNPGVAGQTVTFTAIVSGAAPHWANDGGTTATPTGTVTFTVNGTAVSPSSVSFVGDSGNSAIYTYTTPTSSLTATPNTITASYGGDANYLASSSHTLSYQVVSAASAGSGTIAAGSAASPLSLRGGPTFSINYNSATDTPTAPGTVTYVDTANGINLTGNIASVVFSANGKQAEISGTGTNGSADTPVNFTLFVSNQSGGWSWKPQFSISIVGNTPVAALTGTGLDYQRSEALASGNTVTISQTGSTATIPFDGGLTAAHDQFLKSWSGDGAGSNGVGSDGDGSARGGFGGFGIRHHGPRW